MDAVTIQTPNGKSTIFDPLTSQLFAIKDFPMNESVEVKIKGIPRFLLWSGSTEYAAASAWTNESVFDAVCNLIALSADNMPWC